MRNQPPNYIPHIDGLRAIAVLSVVLYHLEPTWIPGGFAGVDVFFVISGYVISASLGSREHPSLRPYAAGFYSRRMTRLLPALLVCLFVTGFVMTLFVPHIWRGEAPRLYGTSQLTSIAGVFGLSNFLLVLRGDNYFGDTAELNPFTHTWSLGVEEQFYFLFPLMFFFWVRAGASRRDRQISVSLLIGGAITSLFVAAWAAKTNPSFGFYLVFARFWELAIGALLFQFHACRTAKLPAKVANPILIIAITSLAFAFIFANPQDFPYPWAMLPALSTAGAIAAMHGRTENVAARILGSRPMLFFGRTSYSFYLWHWPVFVLFRWTTGIEESTHKLMALTTAFALMLLSYKFVENPVRHSPWVRQASPKLILLAGASAMLVTAGLLAGTYALGERISLSVTGSSAAYWYPTVVPLASEQRCTVEVSKSAIATGKRRDLRSKCPLEEGNVEPTRLFVLGDSHASSYSTLLATIASRSNMHISLLAKGGCPVPGPPTQNQGSSSRCQQFVAAAWKAMTQEIDEGMTLFLPSFRMVELQRSIRRQDKESQPRTPDIQRINQLTALLAPLAEKGVNIVLEAPKPIVGIPFFRCSDWFNQSNPACNKPNEVERSVVERYRAPVLEEYRSVQKNLGTARIWDPLPALCKAQHCPGYMDGLPLFMDENHISGYGNARLVESFEQELMLTRAQP